MILAGDVGGTKTVIAHYEESGGGLVRLRAATYHSRDYPSLEAILAAYLKGSPGAAPRVGCFGVPGTVLDGKCHTTNLPWQLDDQALESAIGARRVKLLNDLEATGYGILQLPADELCVLNPGSRPGRGGNAAVIAAGTGLGEALLYWDGQRHPPIASEGGHVDFAPRTDQEIELLRYLRAKIGGRVSVERVLSGRRSTTFIASCATVGTPRNRPSSPPSFGRRTRTPLSRAWGWPAKTRSASRRSRCSRRFTAPRPVTWR